MPASDGAVPLLIQQLLVSSATATANTTAQSRVVANYGDKVVVSFVILNIDAGANVTVAAEGSYNGVSWTGVNSTSANAIGYGEFSATTVAYAFLRVRVTAGGTVGKAVLINVGMAISQQA